MEISDEAYRSFDSKSIFDVTAEDFYKLDRERRRAKIAFAKKRLEINARYDNETRKTHYWFPRSEHTPKQKRRIRKQTNKWRRRLLGVHF